LAGKTRVAPKCKISIPRMELMGALLAVRLARKISDSLKTELDSVDQKFVGTRVSEIKCKSKPEKEWYWIPGELTSLTWGQGPQWCRRTWDKKPLIRRDSRG
jgi:hypothetical protein